MLLLNFQGLASAYNIPALAGAIRSSPRSASCVGITAGYLFLSPSPSAVNLYQPKASGFFIKLNFAFLPPHVFYLHTRAIIFKINAIFWMLYIGSVYLPTEKRNRMKGTEAFPSSF